MKHWKVTIDLSATCDAYVDAETAEEAEEIARKKVSEDPYYHVKTNGWLGDASVWSDGTEEVDEDGYPIG